MARKATVASLPGNRFCTPYFWPDHMRRRTLPGVQPLREQIALRFQRRPTSTDAPTDALRGKMNLKPTRGLRIAGRNQLKIFCNLLCMGKDATLSRTLTHARQGDSLIDIRMYIYIYVHTYTYIYTRKSENDNLQMRKEKRNRMR